MKKGVVSATVLFLSAAGPALAQETAPKTALLTTRNAPQPVPPQQQLTPPKETPAAPAEAPPSAPNDAPPNPIAAPPPLYVIPPPLPAYIDIAEIEALEESGHDQVVTGNVLLAAAGAIGVTGIGLLISSSSSQNCTTTVNSGHLVYEQCGASALGSAGGFAILLGVLLTIPGSSLQESGQRDLARAEQLRRNACNSCSVSVRPKISREGGGAELALKF